jgi:hypothetical protein
MGRSWISIPILRTGIRIGRSWADADLRPRLPAWKKWELRRGLKDAAKARGDKMTWQQSCQKVATKLPLDMFFGGVRQSF